MSSPLFSTSYSKSEKSGRFFPENEYLVWASSHTKAILIGPIVLASAAYIYQGAGKRPQPIFFSSVHYMLAIDLI